MSNMDRSTIISTIVKIVVVSLLVGWGLTVFDVTPQKLMANLGGTVQDIFEIMVSMFSWAVPYILLGAVVVVPIWIVIKLWAFAKARR